MVLGLAQLLVDFYRTLDDESMFLSEGARRNLVRCGNGISALYASLTTLADNAGVKLWRLTPKLHLFIHLCLNASDVTISHINQRYSWTYADEDLVGQMVDVAQSVHASTVAVSLLFKWVHLAFKDAW